MTLTTFLAILLAALLHASWNVLVKLHPDRMLSLTVLQTLMALLGVAMLAWFGLPGEASWPFALASGVLHTGYNFFLVRAYRAADLSQVYPVARGTAPLLTLLGTFLLLHDVPGLLGTVGIVVLVVGLLATGMTPRKEGHVDPHAVYYALGTAVFIAIYTLVDGLGARASGNPFGYAALVFMLDGFFLLATVTSLRGPAFVGIIASHWRQGLVGAAAASAAYAIVLWAMTQAPIASVAALRETSIVFVLLMSAHMLRETLTPRRIAGGLLIMAGAALLRLA